MRHALILALLLGACAPYHLASSGKPPSGAIAQTDIDACRSIAVADNSTAADRAAGFVAGMTLIGAPIAYEVHKGRVRQAFVDCLTARGWMGVTPATD